MHRSRPPPGWHGGDADGQIAAFASTAEAAIAAAPKRDSILWRCAGDARVLCAAGYALILQVSHPTVAAGVRDHSDYERDPWGRLLRTLDWANLMVYGGPAVAAQTGHRLRRSHAQITGTTPQGRPYSALEPEAFAWVHATLIEAIVTGHHHFGCSLDRRSTTQLYAEWRSLGRLIGIGDDDLPADWDRFREYFVLTVEQRLEDSDVVQGVLASLRDPARPPVPLLADWAWRLGRMPAVRLLLLATVGLLPPTLRERCGVRWGKTDALQLSLLGAGLRSLTPLMPASFAVTGPVYLRLRGHIPAGTAQQA